MKSKLWMVLTAVLALSGFNAMAVTYNSFSYIGSRSVNAGGITASPNWNAEAVNATLLWDIQYAGNTWNYTYTWRISKLTGDNNKELSHIIFEVSQPADPDDAIMSKAVQYTDTSNGNSNPDMPSGGIFGVKFGDTDPEVTRTATGGFIDYIVEFSSTHGPMWGDFYAKDGKYTQEEVYAYNTGFGSNLSDVYAGLTWESPTQDADAWKYVLVPDSVGIPGEKPTPPPVPDAGTTVSLIGLALLGIEGIRRRLS